MKIRIKGNTVRYRLVKTEVKKLSEGEIIVETTDFPTTVFSYELQTKKGIEKLEADFSKNKITMYIPEQEAKEWNLSDRITYKNMYHDLLLILEKDFVCLDHTDEDQSDNYANPNATC